MIALPTNRFDIQKLRTITYRHQEYTSVLVVTFLRWVAAMAAATQKDGREIGGMKFHRFTKGNETQWLQTSMRSTCYG